MNDLINDKVSPSNTHVLNNTDEEQKSEIQLFGSENQMSKLQGLSNLLYTRGRLQELGCTFNELGKLLTYGDPSSLKEWDQLLRLGPIYDEQWAVFFAASLDPQNNSIDNMWPDLRTLKRVLANEGVIFGRQHRRLTRGDQSNKLLRLCAAYDDLFKLWFTMAKEGTSYHVTTTIDECEEDDSNESIDDSGCFMDECHERAHTDPETSIGEDPEHVSASLGISTTSSIRPTFRPKYQKLLAGALAKTLIRAQLPATAIRWILIPIPAWKTILRLRNRYLLSPRR
jgi:hypothetical protein